MHGVNCITCPISQSISEVVENTEPRGSPCATWTHLKQFETFMVLRNLHGDKRQGLLMITCPCCCSRQDLKALLAEYRDYPALAVNWVWFGYNGRMTRPAQPGMLRWYTQCNPKPYDHIKVIVNSKYVAAIHGSHPHNVWYKCAPITMHAMQESVS
jgi:hypothetical protein